MKKSILFIDQFREVTGGQIVLQSLVTVAQDAGYRVGVLAPMGGGLEAALKARWGERIDHYDLHELSLQSGQKGWRDAVRLLAFSFYLLRFLPMLSSYGVIYVNGGRLTLPFALLSLLAFRPRWIYHLHLCHSRLEKRLLSLIARLPRTGSVVLASSYIQEDFARARPEIASNGRVCVIENCLNPPFSELPFVDRFTSRSAPLNVALIGRVSPVKGHALLPGLARALPNLQFTIIGRIAPDQREFADSLFTGAPSNLAYAGETANLPDTINRLPVHISIVPSRWEEPFGLVSIESMAASCITLVSDRGMLPHIAACTGAWCFHDDEELAAMLTRLREMPRAELREIAAQQHASVIRQFGFGDFRRRILRVIAPDAVCHTDVLLSAPAASPTS